MRVLISTCRAVSKAVPFETTLHVRDHCLCLHAQRAARALARRFDAGLKPHGLTSGQFSLLMSLNRPTPTAMRPVAELLAIDRTTLIAALKPLKRRGLVNVAVDPGDRRGRLLSLTDEGMRLLVEALPTWERLHGDEEARLSNADLLRAELDALR